MKYKVVTNESFEKYIDYLSRKEKFESRNRDRRLRFEDRWDTLDLDDITADVNVPSEGEVDAAVRELDLFDDVAIKTGAGDVDVAGDGKLRLLDLDPEGSPNKKSSEPDRDRRTAGLDLDDEPKKKDEPKPLPLGRRARADAILKDLAKQQADAKSKEEPIRELDLDEKGADVKKKKSNVGAIGALDYDDDVDTSKIAASIEDVYTALSSSDAKVVKSMVKRYAGDITDENRIREILLAHAVKLNYESLRVMCGDMKVVLTAKEKELGFIDRADIKDALARFKTIASKLTGENNTYGLIPNAIVSCSPESQTKCINIIDFLTTWCDLPLLPIYFRGSMIRRLYQLADYIIDELPDVKFDDGYLTGSRGLLTRIKNYDDVPKGIIEKIAAHCDKKKLSARVMGDFVIMCLSNSNNKAAKALFKDMSASKMDLVVDYVDDNDMAAYQKLAKLLKLDTSK